MHALSQALANEPFANGEPGVNAIANPASFDTNAQPMETIRADGEFHDRESAHRFLSANQTTFASGDADGTRKRAAKRPTLSALIKAAHSAGLRITAIESGESGVRLLIGGQTSTAGDDEAADLDRLMVEQMGVARMGGRSRR